MRATPDSIQSAGRGVAWLYAADSAIAGAMRVLAFKPYAAAVALAALCALLYLPGIATLPVTDRDEARFAQATKQMIETGNYIDIRFQAEPRYKKPIGIYWLQAAAVNAAQEAGADTQAIWPYRIPSFLGALSAVLLTFWAGRGLIGKEPALVAGALLACCLMVSFEARIAKSDAALLATVMLSQGALFRLAMSLPNAQTKGLTALFWLGLGAAILIKGPVVPALATLTVATVLWRSPQRNWLKHLHWRWGLPLLLLVTLPWFIAIGIASHGEFFQSSLGHDFAGKLQSGQESHWAPPAFYFVAFWWTFWPASLFVTGGAALSLWHRRRSRRVLFLLAWIVPLWLLIEVIPTKLPHYALPLYPAIAMAAATAWREADFRAAKPGRWTAAVWGVLAVVNFALLLGLSWMSESGPGFLLLGTVTIMAAVSAVTLLAWRKMFHHLALAGAVVTGVLFHASAFSITLPRVEPIWITTKASAAAAALRVCGSEPVAFGGLTAPSLVFLNGTATVLTAPLVVSDLLASGKISLGFIPTRDKDAFSRYYKQKAAMPPRFIGCVDGIDINGRGPMRFEIFSRTQSEARPGCSPIPLVECRPAAEVRWRRLLRTPF